MFPLPDDYPGDSSSSSDEVEDKVVVATDEYGIPWDIKHAKKKKVTAQVWNHVHKLHKAIEGNNYICLVCAQEASERQYASANAWKKGLRGDGSCTSNFTKHFGRAHPYHPIGVSSILSKAKLGRVKSESSQQESQNKGLDSPY